MDSALSEWLRTQGLAELAPSLAAVGVASLERLSALTVEQCTKARRPPSPLPRPPEFLFFSLFFLSEVLLGRAAHPVERRRPQLPLLVSCRLDALELVDSPGSFIRSHFHHIRQASKGNIRRSCSRLPRNFTRVCAE